MNRKANLVLRSFNQAEELEVGKTVFYEGKWIIHCWVYGKYQRHSQGAWGVRAPVIRFMIENGIEGLYFWDNQSQITYSTTLSHLRLYSTPGRPDQFGGTMNLPKEHWLQLERLSVGWVPKEDRVILQAAAEPWNMPKSVSSTSTDTHPKTPSRPVVETLALPF
jgi:hypothetical protein